MLLKQDFKTEYAILLVAFGVFTYYSYQMIELYLNNQMFPLLAWESFEIYQTAFCMLGGIIAMFLQYKTIRNMNKCKAIYQKMKKLENDHGLPFDQNELDELLKNNSI
ncbi:MAG: hypothetical protein HRU28_11880 [Rhizobiales bacterium]|nr:hypothetical protein [Hyphomicrobiales bacterium]